MFRFLRRFNTHAIAQLGLALLAIAAVPNEPQIHAGLTLLPAHTQTTIATAQVAAGALGALLTYFGRPQTITQPADTTSSTFMLKAQ